MERQITVVKGKRFVLIDEGELKRLERLAAKATKAELGLPAYPPADVEGNRPALEYIQVSIARDIIKERRSLGLTQDALAKLAGVWPETLCRLETGKHSPTVRTVEKIERALAAERKRQQRRKGK